MPTLHELQAMFRRHADVVGFRSFTPPVYAFRVALANGQRLDMAVETVRAADEKCDVVRALHDLLADGIMTGWATSRETRESRSCNHMELPLGEHRRHAVCALVQ